MQHIIWDDSVNSLVFYSLPNARGHILELTQSRRVSKAHLSDRDLMELQRVINVAVEERQQIKDAVRGWEPA